MTVGTEEIDTPTPAATERPPARPSVAQVVRFVLAVAVAALATRGLVAALPNLLPAHTDIVGFPIHHPFDVRHYYAVFALWMVVFPALALLGYVLLGFIKPLATPAREGIDSSSVPTSVPTATAPEPRPSPRPFAIAAGILALAVATVPIALAVGIVGLARDQDFGATAFGAGLVVAVLAIVLALVIRAAAHVPAAATFWAVAALVAPGAFVALSLLSSESGIGIGFLTNPPFRRVSWFPWWVGLPATVAGIAVVVWALYRWSPAAWRSVGRWALVVCTAPATLWILVGRLGAVGTGDLFHEGELLVGAQQLLDGRFPWRDFISTHGLLVDSFQSLIGLKLIEDTVWGAATGTAIWAVPAYWIASFAFAAYLFRRNLWLLVAWGALVVASPLAGTPVLFFPATPLFVEHFRVLLYPLLLLAMAWLVRRPNWVRTGVLSFLLVVQVVVTPESAYLVPAVFVTLVAFDWSLHPGASWLRRFPTTLLTALWSGGFVILFAAYLAANDALGDFVDYFRIFAAGHELTGGIPVTGTGAVFDVSVYLPPVLFLISIWYVIARIRGRRPLERDDWVLMPAFFFAVLYYTKFLARADVHSLHSFAVVTPLLWYVVARILARADGAWSRRGAIGRVVPHGVTLVAATVVIVLLAPGLQDRFEQTPDRFRTVTVANSPIPRLGYTNADSATVSYGKTAKDSDAVIHALAPVDPKVFDFTNNPELFHFTLGFQPPTRFYHVSMAIPKEAQRELIDELRDSKPEVVVGAGGNGLGAWDGIPNMVRHYDVNRYLLTHYRPVVGIDGIVYLLRNDLPFDPATIDRLSLSGSPEFTDLDQRAPVCAWGAAPERFAPKPADDAKRSGRLDPTPVVATEDIIGWAADSATGKPLPSVIALSEDGTLLATAVPGDDRRDVVKLPNLSGSLHSGFHLAVPVASGEVITIAGRRADGTLVPISDVPRGVATVVGGTQVRVGTTTAPVDPLIGGAVSVAKRIPLPASARAVRMPEPGRPVDWSWMRIRAASGLAPGRYTVGPPAGNGPIRWRVVSRGRSSLDVMVGACNQWYDGRGVTVLSFPAGGPVPSVELIG